MLTCKEYSELKKKELKEYIEKSGLKPCLVVIQVGDRPESNSYIRGKVKDCEEVGIECSVTKYSEDVTQERLEGVITNCNKNTDVHGIIVQLPVPDHINIDRIQDLIAPEKDVDGFGLRTKFEPCTPLGVIQYLMANDYEFEGKDALVIGRSDIVGKPLARMLTDLDCTVTLAHSKTKDIDGKIEAADILFTCIDKIEHYSLDYFDPKDHPHTIIDIGLGVGYGGKLRGNLRQHTVETLKRLCPDNMIISGKGGVGLLTRVALLENVVKACDIQNA